MMSPSCNSLARLRGSISGGLSLPFAIWTLADEVPTIRPVKSGRATAEPDLWKPVGSAKRCLSYLSSVQSPVDAFGSTLTMSVRRTARPATTSSRSCKKPTVDHDAKYLARNLSEKGQMDFRYSRQQDAMQSLTRLGAPRRPFQNQRQSRLPLGSRPEGTDRSVPDSFALSRSGGRVLPGSRAPARALGDRFVLHPVETSPAESKPDSESEREPWFLSLRPGGRGR